MEAFKYEEFATNKELSWKESRIKRQTEDPEGCAKSRANTHKYRKWLFGSEQNFTKEDILRIYEEQGGECFACYADFKKEPYEIDHKVSLKLGGNNHPSNIQLLCKFCNVSKSDQDYYQWLSATRYIQVAGFLSYLAEGGY